MCIILVRLTVASAQSTADFTGKVDHGDSAIYYLQRSLKTKPADMSLYNKAFAHVESIDFNDVTVLAVIDSFAEAYRRNMDMAAYNPLRQTILSMICRSDSLDRAIKYGKGIVTEYNNSRDPNLRPTALIALMELRIPLRNKDMVMAFAYYTDQLSEYLSVNDSTALNICYFCMGSCYRLQGLPDMAVYNFKKARSYINAKDTTSTEPISGLDGWMNHTSVLGQLYMEVGDYQAAIKYSNEAKRVRLYQLRQPNVSFINCNIAYAKMMMNDLDSVYYLLDSAFPLAAHDNDYPSMVRISESKGVYFLMTGQLDSAEFNLLKAKKLMQENRVEHFSPAGSHKPNYYLAQVRILQNRYADAQQLLEEEVLLLGKNRIEVLKELKLLIEVYLKLGNAAAADETFKRYTELQKVIYDEERKNRTMSFEVESKIAEAEGTIQDLVTEKKIADITRKYLIGVAALLLVVASVIFNRFRVTKKQKVIIEKEKKRSDELLLNILPAEVAEELKSKGMADAKQFDNVTVMFTDFKGFTQISEKLTPAELVAEIDHCFKAFDNIITRHNIEKIKTIGDAYMCAGGLPISNTTHATDVVSAALEIQQFMQEHLQQRSRDGQEVFEIRIGVHTGQVVAGIVGVKKFAYDIWGDTVNIASRMESSGEAGKINVSGSTYALIKDKFQCVHRGKIQAKNKGEIDMYFVESVK